ncbi:MAG: FimV/HubP family polar landmark protein [Mariprofundaceae bacterium]
MFENKYFKSCFSALLMWIALSFSAIQAQALGFGVPVLKSHLDEVLDVRVPIILAEHENLSQAFVELAKPDEYRLLGLQPYMNMSALRLAVNKDAQMGAYVQLSSVSTMQMPVISLLLKVRYGRNQYYKHVQLILDPILYPHKNRSQALVSEPKMVESLSTSAMPEVLPVQRYQAATQTDWARTWQYGPVRSGDSLSTIAYRLRKDKRWSNHDVMLALYRFNHDAFVGGNMNRLKSGVWLQVPKTEKFKQLLQQQASSDEVKHQWQAKRKQKVVPSTSDKIVQPSAKALLFVGHIGVAEAQAAVPALEMPLAAMKGQLDKLYDKAMTSHIQMSEMDQSLQVLHADMKQLQLEMGEIKLIQKQALGQNSVGEHSQYWMLGFLLLLVLNLMALVFFLHRHLKASDEKSVLNDEVTVQINNQALLADDIPELPLLSAAEQLDEQVHDIESALELGEYHVAEHIIDGLAPKQREHFRVSGLRARLYHETDRYTERDALISQKRDSLSKEKWHLLCGQLPLPLWNALHDAGVIQSAGFAGVDEQVNLDAADDSNDVELERWDGHEVVGGLDAMLEDGLMDEPAHSSSDTEFVEVLHEMEVSENKAEVDVDPGVNLADPAHDFLELGEIEWTPVSDILAQEVEESEVNQEFTSTIQCLTPELKDLNGKSEVEK